MKFIERNEFYRLKIEELLLSLEQVKCLCPNHNLSTGLFAESILRCFLRTVLPQKVSVSQGFIEHNGRLSSQCDIIIYDRINYAPIYAFGDFEIIPNNAVISVIEVKASINKMTFGKVLFDFERLYSMGIQNKYLFIFNGCNSKTIHRYFYGDCVPHYEKPNDKGYRIGETLYNQDSYEYLPKAIISLSPNYYMTQDLCPTNNYWGYVTYCATDNSNKKIVCLQEFITRLLDIIIPPGDDGFLQLQASTTNEMLSMHDALNDLFITDEFPMFHS